MTIPAIKSSNTILYCTQWDACVHFYKDILKFRVTFAKDDWFRELAVNAGARISVADAKRCTIPAGHGAGMTLSWHVDELVELHAYLKEQKVRVTDITQHSWRAPYFYAFDPDGHRIEFWK